MLQAGIKVPPTASAAQVRLGIVGKEQLGTRAGCTW